MPVVEKTPALAAARDLTSDGRPQKMGNIPH